MITIQMKSSTSTITMEMHEYGYKYSEIKCTSTITLEYNHDYLRGFFDVYLVSTVMATFMEYLGVILFSVAVSLFGVLTDYCYPLSRCCYY